MKLEGVNIRRIAKWYSITFGNRTVTCADINKAMDNFHWCVIRSAYTAAERMEKE